VKKNSRGFQTKEPWYILTNFEDLETAIMAYQKRFDIEEMFRDFKSGGFYVGQHLYHWLQLHQMFPKNIEELMQISRYRLKDYIKGQRAIELALSTL